MYLLPKVRPHMDKFGYKSDLNLQEKILITIVRLSELYKKDCSNLFGKYGLTFTQYNVLRILDSSENGTSIISRVGSVMLVSGANMTGIAKRLEKDGFLIRKYVPEDERVTLLQITPQGKKAIKNIEKKKDEMLAKYLTSFSTDEQLELQADLRKLLREAIRNMNSRK